MRNDKQRVTSHSWLAQRKIPVKKTMKNTAIYHVSDPLNPSVVVGVRGLIFRKYSKHFNLL